MRPAVERQHLFEALRQLSSAMAAASLYAPEHQQARALIPETAKRFGQLLEVQPELTLLIIKEDLLYDGKPLQRHLFTERIARLLYARNIGFIRFVRGLTADEVLLLLRVVVGTEDAASLNASALHIECGEVDAGEVRETVRPIARFADLTTEELQSLSRFYADIGDRSALDVRSVSSLISGFVSAFRQESNPLLALVPLRLEDEYTFTHSINVAILNVAQGMSLGLDEQLLHDVGIAGMLHDAGKIFVDKEIIRNPVGLSAEEWEQMRQHPSRGAQYLMNQRGIPALAILTAFEHHMRHDRAGYPDIPEGWQLNLCSELTMISDTFDALRTQRTYKEPWDFARTCGRMLEVSGTQLNPALTLNFLKLLGQLGERLLDSGLRLSSDAPELSEEQLAGRQVCE